jgi:transposase
LGQDILIKKNKPIYLMFQDEARFGRLSDPRSCWAPSPSRPLIKLSLIREYKYIFGAVCPKTGHIDYMFADNMRTDNISLFLNQVSRAHTNKIVVMVVDGASSHKSQSLIIPNNIKLILLPPYSPELNPQERVWNVLRRDYIANRYFDSLDETMEQLESGLIELKRNRHALHSLTCWPWITEIFSAI